MILRIKERAETPEGANRGFPNDGRTLKKTEGGRERSRKRGGRNWIMADKLGTLGKVGVRRRNWKTASKIQQRLRQPSKLEGGGRTDGAIRKTGQSDA